MKLFGAVAAGAALLIASVQAGAAQVRTNVDTNNQPLKITEVAYYSDGHDVVLVTLSGPVATTCAGIPTTTKLAFWYGSSPNWAALQIRLTVAEAALAYGGQVEVFYNDAACYTTSPNGKGTGAATFNGVAHSNN